MNKIKITLSVIMIIIIITVSLILVENRDFTFLNILKQYPEEGLYFCKWNSYHHYNYDEKPFLQLSYFRFHSMPGIEENIKEYILKSDKGDIIATYKGNTIGVQRDLYTGNTLILQLPILKPNQYIIDRLELVDINGKSKIYDIGNWNIQIESIEMVEDLIIGRSTLYSYDFDTYRVELTNNTNHIINIKDLNFELYNSVHEVAIISSDDFLDNNNLSTDCSLNPMQTKTFQFTIKLKEPDEFTFISLRPVLTYSVDDIDKKLLIPTSIISNPPNSDEQVIEYINNFINSRGGM